MRMQHGILAAVIALAALPSPAEEIPADDEKRVTVSEKVGEGALVVRTEGGERRFQVRGGFLQVVDDTVRVVAEYVQGGSDEV